MYSRSCYGGYLPNTCISLLLFFFKKLSLDLLSLTIFPLYLYNSISYIFAYTFPLSYSSDSKSVIMIFLNHYREYLETSYYILHRVIINLFRNIY